MAGQAAKLTKTTQYLVRVEVHTASTRFIESKTEQRLLKD